MSGRLADRVIPTPHRTLETLPGRVALMGVRSRRAPPLPSPDHEAGDHQLRARDRGRARSSPTACRPRTTSAPPPLSPQGSCPVSASSSSPGLDSSWSESRNPSAFPAQHRARGRPRRSRPPTTHRTCRWGPWSSSEVGRRRVEVVSVSTSVVVDSVVGAVSVVTVSISVVVSGCVVVVDSVTVVVDADVVPGDVSVGLGRVGGVTDPVGRVTLLSGGSPGRRLRNHQGGSPRPRRQRTVARGARLGRSCATAGSRQSTHRAHRSRRATRTPSTRASLRASSSRPRQSG